MGAQATDSRDPLTFKVIGAYFGVYRALGWGFLEDVYRRGMCVELEVAGLKYNTEVVLPVYYRDRVIGEYRADIIVEGRVLVELKVASQIDHTHRAQVYNYLKATTIETALLFNFGPRPAFARLLLSNDRKRPGPLQL